jgi:hypothetical protein
MDKKQKEMDSITPFSATLVAWLDDEIVMGRDRESVEKFLLTAGIHNLAQLSRLNQSDFQAIKDVQTRRRFSHEVKRFIDDLTFWEKTKLAVAAPKERKAAEFKVRKAIESHDQTVSLVDLTTLAWVSIVSFKDNSTWALVSMYAGRDSASFLSIEELLSFFRFDVINGHLICRIDHRYVVGLTSSSCELLSWYLLRQCELRTDF